jgi:hypothetical protein
MPISNDYQRILTPINFVLTGSQERSTDVNWAQSGKPGPKPETLKIEGNWKQAVDKALKKKRPKAGWPKPEPSKKG